MIVVVMTVVTMTVVIVWSEVMPTGTTVMRQVVCLEGVPIYVTTPEAGSVFRGCVNIRDNS